MPGLDDVFSFFTDVLFDWGWWSERGWRFWLLLVLGVGLVVGGIVLVGRIDVLPWVMIGLGLLTLILNLAMDVDRRVH